MPAAISRGRITGSNPAALYLPIPAGPRPPAEFRPFPDPKAAEAKSRGEGAPIEKLQDRLYAEGKRALLVVLQGIDTAGKDGTVRHVFKEAGPLGVNVTSFRKPSEE